MTNVSRDAIRQAIYDAYFAHFGGDEQDQDDIEAADEFCNAVMRLIDGDDRG